MTRKLSLTVAAIATAGIAGTAVASALPAGAGLLSSLVASHSNAAGSNQPNGRPNFSRWCEDLVGHFRQNLGVTQDRLQGAYQQAVNQTISDAVKAGALTAEQGKRLESRLDKRPLCAAFGLGRRGHEGGELRHDFLQAAASVLNLSPETLLADLKGGQTLSSLAHGMTEDQFRTALIAKLKPLLDAEVANHRLDPAREQKILDRLQSGSIPFWNSPPHWSAAPAQHNTTGA